MTCPFQKHKHNFLKLPFQKQEDQLRINMEKETNVFDNKSHEINLASQQAETVKSIIAWLKTVGCFLTFFASVIHLS